jgi:hypothetical protein
MGTYCINLTPDTSGALPAAQAAILEEIGEELGTWWLAGGITPANCLAAYQPVGADSLAASYINLANPGTNNAAPGVAPDWTAQKGWIGDGSTQYLLTGIVPAPPNFTMIVRYWFESSSQMIMGSFNNGSTYYVLTIQTNYIYGANNNVTAVQTRGVLAIAGTNGYKNGELDTALTANWSGTGTQLEIFGYRNVNNPASLMKGTIQAVAIYNTILTEEQIEAVSRAMLQL